MVFHLNGDLMSDEFSEILRWYGYTDNVCPGDIRSLCENARGEELTIYVNSDGGSLVAGTEIYSIFREYGGNVTAHIQSRAASAATVAIMGCGRIIAEPVSLICVHNPSACASGDAEEMRHTAEELDNVKSIILNAYASRATVSREELSALMDRDVWLDADKAKTYGLVDEIVAPLAPGTNTAPEREIVNAARRVQYPTQKMIDEYHAVKQSESNRITAAKAWLDTYKH